MMVFNCASVIRNNWIPIYSLWSTGSTVFIAASWPEQTKHCRFLFEPDDGSKASFRNISNKRDDEKRPSHVWNLRLFNDTRAVKHRNMKHATIWQDEAMSALHLAHGPYTGQTDPDSGPTFNSVLYLWQTELRGESFSQGFPFALSFISPILSFHTYYYHHHLLQTSRHLLRRMFNTDTCPTSPIEHYTITKSEVNRSIYPHILMLAIDGEKCSV